MRAAVISSYGGPECLQVRDVPDPVPGPEEVVVHVVATALNRADVMQRRGGYPGPPMDHEIPGLEIAGRVGERGDRADRWPVGALVMGIVGGGAYAERIVVHERQLVAVPEAVPVADAAAIPEAWITAWDALVLQGGLASGGVALVHAGASGVGTAAIQLVKALRARIVVTCSAAKTAECEALGADVAVDYRTGDYVAAVHELTHGTGADVVLDVVGGEYVNRNLACVRTGGRVMQVGLLGDKEPRVDLSLLQAKRAAVIGTRLRARPLEEKILVTQRFGREVVPLFEGDEPPCRPVIDRRYPLSAVADAHRYMESNANIGKIVVDVAPA